MAAAARVRELAPQRITDFFRSASRNMLLTIWSVRIVAFVMLILLVTSVLSILNDEVKDLTNLQILFVIIISVFFVIVLALLTLVTYIATPIDATAAYDYFLASRAFVINQVFGSVASFSSFDENFDDNAFYGSSTDPFGPLAYLINKPQRELYNDQMLMGFILFGIVIMVITGIGFIRNSSVRLAMITLITSQLTIALAYLKDLTGTLTLDTTTIGTLLGSSLFQLALISYLYFEFSLQTGYIYSLTTPTLTRQERVGKQLSRLSEFRLGITKLGTEKEKEQERLKKEAEEARVEEEGRISSSLAAGSGSTAARKYSAEALLFLLDSASDSLFAKPGGEEERLTGRLQRYHDGLLQHDPKLDDKLGGSGEQTFKPLLVLSIVVSSLVFRIVVLIVLARLVLRPQILLTFISLPASIVNSLEISEPEGLLLVLIPVVFILVGGSYLVTKVQEWVIKAEELIIDEADIGRLLRAGREITSRADAERASQLIQEQERIEAKEEAEERAPLPRMGTEGQRQRRQPRSRTTRSGEVRKPRQRRRRE